MKLTIILFCVYKEHLSFPTVFVEKTFFCHQVVQNIWNSLRASTFSLLRMFYFYICFTCSLQTGWSYLAKGKKQQLQNQSRKKRRKKQTKLCSLTRLFAKQSECKKEASKYNFCSQNVANWVNEALHNMWPIFSLSPLSDRFDNGCLLHISSRCAHFIRVFLAHSLSTLETKICSHCQRAHYSNYAAICTATNVGNCGEFGSSLCTHLQLAGD